MLEYDVNQVIEGLALARNPNSALKNFLKQEIKKGDPVAKFIKALKNVLAKKNQEQLAEFVNTYHDKYQPAFFVVTRYIHNQPLGEIVEGIIEQYAEEFNQSYESSDDQITIKDQQTFERIVKSALEEINSGLGQRDLPQSPFMKNLVIDWLFDEAVAREVYKRAQS